MGERAAARVRQNFDLKQTVQQYVDWLKESP